MDVVIERGKVTFLLRRIKKRHRCNRLYSNRFHLPPILRAKYEVSDVRVGNEMDFDKLTLEVWTDGSITAADAVAKSAAIMIGYLGNFTN